MNKTTFLFFVAMYVYGFGLMVWTLYFDKHPTQKTIRAAKFGLAGLILTLFYFFYAILTRGIH